VYHSSSHLLAPENLLTIMSGFAFDREADQVQVTLQSLDTGASRGLRDGATTSYSSHQAIVATGNAL
jgi:hypothetical protein